MRTGGVLFALMLVGVALTAAADFWEEKDFRSWSDREVEEMMTDSPWSRMVTVALGVTPIGPDVSINPWGVRLADGSRDDNRRENDRFANDDSRVQRATLVVTWRSALPVKQAVVRATMGPDARVPPELQQFLQQDEPYYVISVSGIPEEIRQALVSETFLSRENKTPIAPYDIEIVEQDELSMLVWYFPRTDVITLDDDEVEFITKLGSTEVKRQFKLEEMIFEDQLAL